MPTKGCPGADELTALATGRKVAARVERHVQSCDTCADLLVALKADSSLLEELRAAVDTSDERTRRHVLDICKKVAARAAKTRSD